MSSDEVEVMHKEAEYCCVFRWSRSHAQRSRILLCLRMKSKSCTKKQNTAMSSDEVEVMHKEAEYCCGFRWSRSHAQRGRILLCLQMKSKSCTKKQNTAVASDEVEVMHKEAEYCYVFEWSRSHAQRGRILLCLQMKSKSCTKKQNTALSSNEVEVMHKEAEYCCVFRWSRSHAQRGRILLCLQMKSKSCTKNMSSDEVKVMHKEAEYCCVFGWSHTRKLISSSSSSSFHRLNMTQAVAEAWNPDKPNQSDEVKVMHKEAEYCCGFGWSQSHAQRPRWWGRVKVSKYQIKDVPATCNNPLTYMWSHSSGAMRGYRFFFWVIGNPPPPTAVCNFFLLVDLPRALQQFGSAPEIPVRNPPPSECMKPPLLNPGSAPGCTTAVSTRAIEHASDKAWICSPHETEMRPCKHVTSEISWNKGTKWDMRHVWDIFSEIVVSCN